MSNKMQLQIKEDGDEDWSVLNTESFNSHTKSEAKDTLMKKQDRWRATSYPMAQFRIVEA